MNRRQAETLAETILEAVEARLDSNEWPNCEASANNERRCIEALVKRLLEL